MTHGIETSVAFDVIIGPAMLTTLNPKIHVQSRVNVP